MSDDDYHNGWCIVVMSAKPCLYFFSMEPFASFASECEIIRIRRPRTPTIPNLNLQKITTCINWTRLNVIAQNARSLGILKSHSPRTICNFIFHCTKYKNRNLLENCKLGAIRILNSHSWGDLGVRTSRAECSHSHDRDMFVALPTRSNGGPFRKREQWR